MSVMEMAAGPAAPGGPFSRNDLERMPKDGRRYEIIDGLLVVSAAPGRLHQRAVARLWRLLDDASPPGFEALVAPFAVALADDTEMQPDIVVGRDEDFTDRDIAAPLLAVEVLSPSTRLFDTHVKRARFERAGTPSFWIVDPSVRPEDAAMVAWAISDEGRYRQVARVVGKDALVATAPFPVTVTSGDLVR